ncbi:MAG TPA: papain-like cysteine protease family protein [Solirubrobacterales bacterium]|nr:papain-like cysteine protease family protein [Solirubrobacterales bacterium]
MGLIAKTSVRLKLRRAGLADGRFLQPAPPSARWSRLAFSVQPQQRTLWCWAAVAVSVADYYAPPTSWTQCSLASAQFGEADCCANGASKSCNRVWRLDKALSDVGALSQMDSAPADSGGLPAPVGREIDAGRPVGIRIGWDKGGHFIVLDGYRDDGAMVALEDPLYGSSDLPTAILYRGYQGRGSWTHTYFTKP